MKSNSNPVPPTTVRVYAWSATTPNNLRDSIVIALRRSGESAWSDADFLHTSATVLGVGMIAGSTSVLDVAGIVDPWNRL